MMGTLERIAGFKHEDYVQARRDTILNAAMRVFAQSDFAEAKMDQIAAAADLSKASLYLYFPSKHALLHSVLERYALLPELPTMMAALGDMPPALGIPTLIAEIWHLLQQRRELAPAISLQIQTSPQTPTRFPPSLCPPPTR